jgi:hypothetical protein
MVVNEVVNEVVNAGPPAADLRPTRRRTAVDDLFR